MNYKIFKNIFLAIVLVELVSFLGYFYPFVNKAAFFVIIAITLAASLYKLEYGLLIMLSELIIGSKGYLFYFDAQGFSVSIRIALFIVVMAVWSGKIIGNLIKNKKLELEFLKLPLAKYFIILFIFIVLGLINGFLKGNSFNNLFFDFNGWLYFLIVFPVYDVIKVPIFSQRFLEYLMAALLWLCFKTFFLLFLFSHFSMDVVYEIYRWVRVTGVGEIAQIQGGFYRIFFQSHIFALIGMFALLPLMVGTLNPKSGEDPKSQKYFLFSTFCFLLSAVLISFSRSFWIGLIFGLILFFIYLIWRKLEFKKIFQISSFLILSFVISVGFVALIVKFPYPRPTGGFNTTELLSERASEIKGEAAVASRWSLLPELWKEIKTAPILGRGFGATVTYKSSDPRILEQDPKGEYTTYAFEWGWLDVWLKLGFFGMVAYIFLIGKIIYNELSRMSNILLISGLSIGLAVIVVVNIFTPYLNHPLGIGYLILISAIINKKEGLPY